MLNLRFRQENVVKLEYAPRITQVDWDRHANAVKNMHEERKTRREILEALNHEHDFRPSMAQLNTHMRKRKLRVYGKAGDSDGHAVEATATELLPIQDDLLPVEDEILPVANGIMSIEHQVMRDADSVSRADVVPASTSPQTRAVADTSFADMLDLLPLNIGNTTPDRTQTHGEGAEEHNAEGRGRRMSDTGDKSIRAAFEDIENGADVLAKHEQERTPSQYPCIVSREASVCSFRSQHSDLSSLRAFREFAADVSRAAQLRRQASQSSLRSLTIMSEESWNFGLVTGIPSDGLALSVSKAPSATEWEAYRLTIAELYIGRNLSLHSVQDHMTKHYGFRAT